jgi:hypothetical protein
MHGNGGMTMGDCMAIIQPDIKSPMAASSHKALYICERCHIRISMLEVSESEDDIAVILRYT